MPASGISVTFDPKENAATAHPAMLDVTLVDQGPPGAVEATDAPGLAGKTLGAGAGRRMQTRQRRESGTASDLAPYLSGIASYCQGQSSCVVDWRCWCAEDHANWPSSSTPSHPTDHSR